VRESNSQAELQSERMVDAVADFGAVWLLNVGDLICSGYQLSSHPHPSAFYSHSTA
jgi:hypothetical protein